MAPRVAPWLVLALVSSLGCKASVSAKVGSKPQEDDSPPPPSQFTAEEPQVRTAFFGVSHNLSLTPEAAQKATCRCMAAVVGIANNPSFQWRGKPPTVGDDGMVIGISNEGTPCDKPTGGRGPSIAGIEQDGNNIIVNIEEGAKNIPLARGAIFPKPSMSSESWLYFKAPRRLPYDQPASGQGGSVCRIQLSAGMPKTSTTGQPTTNP